jgi:hypothetical protein
VSARVTGWVWTLDLLPQRKLLLLWLANRATDQGVCYPSKREIATQVGLGERMTRYHLAWLACDRDEGGQPKNPLLDIIERPIGNHRSTSNVYVLRVPWADPLAVRTELEELKHMPANAVDQVGATHCTQWVQPVTSRWMQPVAPEPGHQGTVTGNLPPDTPRRTRRHSSNRRRRWWWLDKSNCQIGQVQTLAPKGTSELVNWPRRCTGPSEPT